MFKEDSYRGGGEENLDEAVLAHNFAEMNSSMMQLLELESIGGNAGAVEVEGKKYPCAAANGFANGESGKILAFENWQYVPETIRNKGIEFTLKVAFDAWPSRRGFFKIVDFLNREKFSPRGRRILEEAIHDWNEAQK